MNVFVLCTGRCGSTTLAKAFSHVNNYTAAHESMFGRPAAERFGADGYPAQHIEVDTIMSWFPGPLRKRYGDMAYYIHLLRDRDATAGSLMAHLGRGGFADGYAGSLFLSNTPPRKDLAKSALGMCYDYVDTITENIRWFLNSHPKNMQAEIEIEQPHDRFSGIWADINARGNMGRALRELNVKYNSSNASSGG